MRAVAILGLLLAAFPAKAQAEPFRVVVVPGLELRDLERLESHGAVGLLVPGAGPETSERAAYASLERGEVRNSLRNGLPTGRRLISVATALEPPARGPAIVLSLPGGGKQPNDRRFPVAVLGGGYRGLLTSGSTRIAGLVSIADVAPTALQRADGLDSQVEADASAELEQLDQRIDANNSVRRTASRLAALLILILAVVAPRAALLGVAGLLAVNILLGIAGPESQWVLVASLVLAVAVVGPAAAVVFQSAGAVAAVLASVPAAYLVAFLADQRWIALSPLGPTQNSRFYGLSNLLETLLLVPALVGAALLARRGFALLGAFAAITFVVVAGSRFGADGGGAAVLLVAFGVLAAALAGIRRRWLVPGVAAGIALALAALLLEAATGATSHVTDVLEGGPSSVASSVGDRVALSYARATEQGENVVIVLAGIALLGVLAFRLLRSGRPLVERALPIAFLAAIAVSLVVNDSPVDVVIMGLACYLAVEAYALPAETAIDVPRKPSAVR
jgi:hypothetical protein